MPTAVHLSWAPHSGFLLAWGRHGTGWWGCVTLRVALVDAADELPVAAWVPAHVLSKPNWAGADAVDRVVLPDDRQAWPAPPRWPAWYAGVWAGGTLPLPPGSVMVTGAAWRRSPPRA